MHKVQPTTYDWFQCNPAVAPSSTQSQRHSRPPQLVMQILQGPYLPDWSGHHAAACWLIK